VKLVRRHDVASIHLLARRAISKKSLIDLAKDADDA
jgi:hypothetical protein